jgi:hypothetical protein
MVMSFTSKGLHGLVRAALDAGMSDAHTETRTSVMPAIANVPRSSGVMPNSLDDSRRVTAAAPANPSNIPIDASASPSLTNDCSTREAVAPSAMRMPISFRRRTAA